MNKIYLALIVLLVKCYCFAGTNNDSINYLNDFDYLYRSIKDNSISVDLYCKQLGVNFDSVYSELRKELEKDICFENFINQSNRLFNLSGDWHNGFVSSYYLKSIIDYLPEEERVATLNMVDTNFYSIADSMYRIYSNYTWNNKSKPKFRTIYSGGKYYLKHDYSIGDKLMKRGSEIVSINNIKTRDFVTENINCYFFLYDVHLKQNYAAELFQKGSGLPPISSITFFDEEKKEHVKCNSSELAEIEKETSYILTMNINRVFYHRSSKTLYLRLAQMIEREKLAKQILKYKKKKFERIVIDVRNNSGGSDLVWIKALSELIDSTFYKCRPQLCIKDNRYPREATKSFVKEQFKGNGNILTFDSDIFGYMHSNNNPCLNKPIYCFMDTRTFSSGLVFASLNMYLNNFTLVANSTPYMGGMGLTPFTFMLPHTKLQYKLSCSFDKKLLSAEKHTVQPDVVIPYDYKADIKMLNQKIRNFSAKRYCLRNNPFLEAILKGIK